MAPQRLARYAETQARARAPPVRRTLRPQVVLFGEPLPASASGRASLLAQDAGACLCVGTVSPGLPRQPGPSEACRARRPLAIVSQQPTGLWEDADPRLLRAAEDLLPGVVAILVPDPH